MLKKVLPAMVALAVSGGLAGCYVEDDTPDGGGGGSTVIERERTIERDSEPDVNINNPPAEQGDVKIHNEPVEREAEDEPMTP